MRKPYFRATIDLSEGSAYTYGVDSRVPATIDFGRQHDGKFQIGRMHPGALTWQEMHDVVYLLKRGYDMKEVNEHVKSIAR